MCTDEGIERGLRLIASSEAANDTEGLVLGILLLDRSGSMRHVRAETEEAISEHLRDQRSGPNASRTMMSIFSFANDVRLEVPPTMATELPERISFHPDGNTRLYATVAETLEKALRLDDQSRDTRYPIRMVIVVMTDGEDQHPNKIENMPSAKEKRRLRLVSAASKICERGHTLLTMGLGIDAATIARSMGFPDDSDHAFSVTKNREGIRETMHRTMVTMVSMGGHPPRPSSSTPG